MRIGLISDTHIPSVANEPPAQVARAFEGVDLIIHAGHIFASSCIEWLERIAPVKTSESWMEGTGEALARSGRIEVLELEGHSIGLVHELILVKLGDEVLPGSIERKFPPGESLSKTLQNIFGKPVDTVVFGQTHEAMVELHDGVLLVNPGSPNMVKQVQRLGTVAILEVTPESREARIIDLAKMDESASMS